MFVPKDALAEILCHAEVAGPFAAESRLSTAPPPLEEVMYVQCPLCHVSMNRVNFGKLSGVIVDVCRKHGTWFDAGELTRAVGFAANGGLKKAKAREEADHQAEMKDLQLKKALVHLHVASTRERYEMEEQVRRWERFLRNIFWW
jgi:Zn-finger nucleic acid-binding protein